MHETQCCTIQSCIQILWDQRCEKEREETEGREQILPKRSKPLYRGSLTDWFRSTGLTRRARREDKDDSRGQKRQRAACRRDVVAAASLLQAAGNANLFLLPSSESGAMPGQSSKTLMDTLGRAGRTATFPGNVLSFKARSVRGFTL